MKRLNRYVLAGSLLLNMFILTGSLLISGVTSGCGGSPAVNKEQSVSAIRAAEEVGAAGNPGASLYLQLAKEGLKTAKGLAEEGEMEKAESMLLRVQADAELAVALSRGEVDKNEAAQAIERVRQLRQDNNLPQGRN